MIDLHLSGQEGFVMLAKKALFLVGKLFILLVFAIAFLVGMIGAIWFSLHGEEIKVPEVVGKDFYESEKELASLGLRIKRRAYRYSNEKPNTIIEQAPRPGETVKTGQTILVVVAQANPEGTEAPATVKKESAEEDDSLSETLLEDYKKDRNTTFKRLERTRDVISNKTNRNSNVDLKANQVDLKANQNVNKSVNQNVNKSNESSVEKKSSEAKAEPKPARTPNVEKSPTPPTGNVRDRRVIP